MPRKKKEPSPPPAPDRPIKCAFCQKELDPQKGEATFIGMGKWRDGPGLFHAVCSGRTQEDEDNPCLQSGIAWATKFAKNEPVLFSYEQWKANIPRCKSWQFKSSPRAGTAAAADGDGSSQGASFRAGGSPERCSAGRVHGEGDLFSEALRLRRKVDGFSGQRPES